MKELLVASAILGLAVAPILIFRASDNSGIANASAGTAKSVYEFKMKNIDGKEVDLSHYKGKVLMLVNVASKCGYTPQYEALQTVYSKYKDRGFIVLGFPANNFMGQEPGTEAEIKEFCSVKYSVTFPLFSKISVKGNDQHPLYQYLTSMESNPQFGGEIKWNFNKFIVGKDGKIIARFEPKVTPDSVEVIRVIENAIK